MFSCNVFCFTFSSFSLFPQTSSSTRVLHSCMCRKRGEERKKILLYYKALIFLELFFIQATVFVRKTHNLKFSVLVKIFLFTLSLLLLASSRIHGVVEKVFFFSYIFYVCIIFNLESVVSCCIVLKKTQKLTVIFFSLRRHGFVRKRLLISSGVRKSADIFYL